MYRFGKNLLSMAAIVLAVLVGLILSR